MRFRPSGLWGCLVVAMLATACQRLAPDAPVVPTATLTGTVEMPARTLSAVTPPLLAGSGSSQTVPVPFARVQALDASLKPIVGVPEARTDAGGHFAIDVPAGRPYILRFVVGNPDRHIDFLAVADPEIGDGAQLITVDAAMHVATQLILDRTDGIDSALQAIGAQDVQALVDAVRKTLSPDTAGLTTPASLSAIADAESQNDDVQNVLSRLDPATASATSSVFALQASPSADATPSLQSLATADATADLAAVAPSPLPSPPQASPAASTPPYLTPEPDDETARARKTGPDAASLAWAREFAWSYGPDTDPFKRAAERAHVGLEPLVRSHRSTDRRPPARSAEPPAYRPLGFATTSPRAVAGLPRVRRPVRPFAQAQVAPIPRAASSPTRPPALPARPKSFWSIVLAAITRWIPHLSWPTLAL